MTEAGLLAYYDTSLRTYDTVYVEIVGSSSPRIAARDIRILKVIVTRVRIVIRVHVHSPYEKQEDLASPITLSLH